MAGDRGVDALGDVLDEVSLWDAAGDGGLSNLLNMKILTVDIGTGTQDIFLYDLNLDIENGFKLVLPSPTMMVHRRLKQMLPSRIPVLLSGHQMGGGPSAWAIEEYARAGIPVYMTPPRRRRSTTN